LGAAAVGLGVCHPIRRRVHRRGPQDLTDPHPRPMRPPGVRASDAGQLLSCLIPVANSPDVRHRE
jgi:hypothetical protein